jgi:stearoyl-CoA desaturase (delta-9 desaturase)
MLGVNIGYHRLISHRSFQTYDFIEKFFSVLGVLTIIGSPLAWTAIHRQHHRSAETSKDPHSPYILGKFNAWVGLWNKDPLDLKLIRDMRKNKFQKFLHHNYLSIIIAYCIILALINPLLVIFAFSIPACLSLFSTSAVIVIAHFQGYKTYDLKHDQARNSWVTHVLSLGEGWHNNHHAKPYQWNQGEKWWEFDPPSWIIRLIKK